MVFAEYVRSHHLEIITPQGIRQGFGLMIEMILDPKIQFSKIEKVAPNLPIYWTRKIFAAAVFIRGALYHFQASNK